MQTSMPEAGFAAIDRMYTLAHEREYLRTAAIDLMRAGLPSNVAADICEFARTRRRECSMMRCCGDSRYTLSVSINNRLIAVVIHSGARVAAAFRFRPDSCEIVCDDRCEVHKGQLKNMPRAFHDAAETMLGMAAHFSTSCGNREIREAAVKYSTGYPYESRVIREAAEYVRDLRDPPAAWWSHRCTEIDIAHVSDAEVVVRGRASCEACDAWWKEFCSGMNFMVRDPGCGEMDRDA